MYIQQIIQDIEFLVIYLSSHEKLYIHTNHLEIANKKTYLLSSLWNSPLNKN